MTNQLNKTDRDRLIYFATAPRATAKTITKTVNLQRRQCYGGALRGEIIQVDGIWLFNNKTDAIDNARHYRDRCKNKLINDDIVKKVTCWSKKVDGGVEHNHIADGHVKTRRPTPQYPRQQVWRGLEWNREWKYMTPDKRVITL